MNIYCQIIRVADAAPVQSTILDVAGQWARYKKKERINLVWILDNLF
jgi:hypothetical protein